jgi:DNA invertase Pin-like site-specific DNA recombinase
MNEQAAEPAVGYWRISSSPQEKSIPQQKAEMLPRAKLAGLEVVREFQDEGISGGGMRQRDAFLDMLRYCQEQAKAGRPIAAIVCYNASRLSRADSNETAHYIWDFRQAGVNRLLTWERWYDFRKEQDRTVFNIEQEFTNHRFLRDLSAGVLRGKKDAAVAGYFTGGAVPYGFDRLLLDGQGCEVARIRRGEKVFLRKQGCREVLAPIPEDDPDPARQLERQTAVWLFQTFGTLNVSYRGLAEQLNRRGVPGPGGKGWTPQAVRRILTNSVYAGVARLGETAKGRFHRLIGQQITAVEPGARKTVQADGLIIADLEHGGLIDQAAWQRVREKARQRARLGVKPRTGGYVLPGGILHCGHCGGPMYGCTMRPRRGDRVYEYRKYACSASSTRPGTCRAYAVDEAVILDRLVEELLGVYLAPDRLEGLRCKVLEKVEARHERAPATADRLRRRLVQLDAEIRDAARNVLRAKDNVDLLNEALTKLRQQRARLAKDLATAERVRATPVDDTAALAEAAVARLFGLRERLEHARDSGKRELFAEPVRLLVLRVDVYFEPERRGKRQWFRFAKGVIKLRPLLSL